MLFFENYGMHVDITSTHLSSIRVQIVVSLSRKSMLLASSRCGNCSHIQPLGHLLAKILFNFFDVCIRFKYKISILTKKLNKYKTNNSKNINKTNLGKYKNGKIQLDT